MIEQKELRIGNEVYFIDETFCTVIGINWGSTVELAGCEGFISITDLEPIPLTPEILEKCGFSKSNYPNKTIVAYRLDIGDDGFKIIVSFVNGKLNNVILEGNGSYDEAGEKELTEICKYLHQLQNLIHSLTGTELTINL